MYSNYLGSSFNGPTPGMADTSINGNCNVMAMMNEHEAVGLLQHLDKTDLEHLLNNDAKLNDLVNDLAQVRRLQAKHDNLVATNKSLAEYNISQRPRLEDLKHHVASQYERLNELKTCLAEGKARLDGYVGRQKLDTVLALLQTETAKTEEASEELADKFCEDGNIDSFLGDFLTQRALAHQRRIKAERFAELIHQQQGQGSVLSSSSASSAVPSMRMSSQYHNNHGSSAGYSASVHQAPYPTSAAFGMPHPPSVFPR